MAVVGIDLGSQNTKAVILEGDEILGGASLETGESAETEARMAVQEALRQTGLKREDLKAAVATGTLAVPVTMAVNIAALKQRSAASCIAMGAYFRYPQARTVLYVGADSSMAIRLSADGQVEDSVKNERCAVSSGALLDIVSRMLEIPVAEMGRAVAAGHRPADRIQPVRRFRRGRDPVLHPQGAAGADSRCARGREPVDRRRPVGNGEEGGRAL